MANGWLNSYDWRHFDMNDSAVVGYPDLSASEILKATKQAALESYLRPRQVWRLLRLMHAARDFTLLTTIARNFLSWIFWKKEDRIPIDVAATANSRSTVATVGIRPLRPLAVLEPPRRNPRTAKPGHDQVRLASIATKGPTASPLPIQQGRSTDPTG